jgi:hypothetical protein
MHRLIHLYMWHWVMGEYISQLQSLKHLNKFLSVV